MGKPFRVTIDLGGSTVTFDLTEEDLTDRAKRDIKLRATMSSAEGRDGFRRAAYDAAHGLLTRDDKERIIRVHEDNSKRITMIPVEMIRSVVLEDPEAGDDRRPFGFTDPKPPTPVDPADIILPSIRGMRRKG